MYAASVGEKYLTFEVYGLWRKNMLMKDRETQTIWQHATGEAISGPLKGSLLEALPAWETTWDELRNTHPNACFAVEPGHYTGLVPIALIMSLLPVTNHASLAGLSPRDRRLDAHEVVIGVTLNGAAKAYPLGVLQAAHTIQDTVGGREITLRCEDPGERVSVCTSGGEAVYFEKQWWLGWSEFHPHTTVYGMGLKPEI